MGRYLPIAIVANGALAILLEALHRRRSARKAERMALWAKEREARRIARRKSGVRSTGR